MPGPAATHLIPPPGGIIYPTPQSLPTSFIPVAGGSPYYTPGGHVAATPGAATPGVPGSAGGTTFRTGPGQCCIIDPPPGFGAPSRIATGAGCLNLPSGWTARPIPCAAPPPYSGVPISPNVPPAPAPVQPANLPPAAPATPMPTIRINGQQAICCPCPG